jgi:hypothetical protein
MGGGKGPGPLHILYFYDILLVSCPASFSIKSGEEPGGRRIDAAKTRGKNPFLLLHPLPSEKKRRPEKASIRNKGKNFHIRTSPAIGNKGFEDCRPILAKAAVIRPASGESLDFCLQISGTRYLSLVGFWGD